jgi:hypothetical protein
VIESSTTENLGHQCFGREGLVVLTRHANLFQARRDRTTALATPELFYDRLTPDLDLTAFESAKLTIVRLRLFLG